MLLAAALVACGAGSVPVPTATPSPQPTPTPVDLGPPEPQAERILEHIRALSVDIGARLAGSAQEGEAVDYARERFEGWGYRVEVQPFTVSGPGVTRFSSLVVEEPVGQELRAVAFEGSGSGEVRGRLVDAGTGEEEAYPPETLGAVVLVQRGDVLFADMARRAQQAGAAGVVVANKEPGLFRGAVEPATALPMIAIDQSSGEALRALLAQGAVEVSFSVPTGVSGRNVIARPQSGPCRTLSGAHYDTVPWAAGANDNASGAGLVLELARATAALGLSSHCFVLFGAEEEGLLGSERFVAQMGEAERAALRAYFNYDVVAGDAPPRLLGSPDLLERAAALAAQAGLPVERDGDPLEIASDHRAFLDAGIPTLLLTTPDFGRIHTAEDTAANLRPTFLGAVAELGFALLREAGQGPEATPQAMGLLARAE